MTGQPQPIQVVWFKRDLRIRDHWPLVQAAKAGPVVALYCFEPSQVQQPDYAARHHGFIVESLAELQHDLGKLGVRLLLWRGEACSALTAIREQAAVAGLWSHQETSNLAGFARDKQVATWCKTHGTVWTEFPQAGVVRRLASRDAWASHWEAFMAANIAPLPDAIEPAKLDLPSHRILDASELGLPDADIPARQTGGRRPAVAVLAEFLQERASSYRGGISSPLKAPGACSRLSPYLAWGNLSVRETLQATRRRMAEIKALSPDAQPANLLPSLRSFESRLHWHCHFIQKLETEPTIEIHNMHRGYDGLREAAFDEAKFEAWQQGETGYPLVDACMAMLRQTGWLNFRMRAMLVSFASYNLWLHWQRPAWHLATLFTDYEPGIHYPQFQMQSGVTGINALRIYNPIKQAQDHDAQGYFVRRYLPALRRVPDTYLFEPWQMPDAIQHQCGVIIGRDYPPPIVDFTASYREAKARFSAWRTQPGLREQSRQVFEQHGSRQRKQDREWVKRSRPIDRQLGLFGEDT